MKISLLKKGSHNRDSFSCGSKELDDYLQKYALQDIKRNLTKVFILEGNIKEEIVGYYTLSPLSFSKEEISPHFSQKLSHYPVPAVLLGRLAVSLNYQKQRWGSFLLLDALLRILKVSEADFGIYAVVVDSKNNEPTAFYQHFGFISFIDRPNRLFLPLETIKSLV